MATLTTPTGRPILDLRAEHARVCHLIRLGHEAHAAPGLDIYSIRQIRRVATANMQRLDALLAAMSPMEQRACTGPHYTAQCQWKAIMKAATLDDDLATRPLPDAGYDKMTADLAPVDPGPDWQPPY